MSDILSKVSASGLSAGVFLLWWPAHITSRGSEALVARGVLWALAFEVLLLGFRPLERAVGRAVKSREADTLAPRRIAPLLALAAVAAVVPVTMLCGARAPIAAPARASAPKVIVKREVVRREVVVRRVSKVVRVPVPAATTSAPTAPGATVRAPAAKPASTTAPARKATTTAKTHGLRHDRRHEGGRERVQDDDHRHARRHRARRRRRLRRRRPRRRRPPRPRPPPPRPPPRRRPPASSRYRRGSWTARRSSPRSPGECAVSARATSPRRPACAPRGASASAWRTRCCRSRASAASSARRTGRGATTAPARTGERWNRWDWSTARRGVDGLGGVEAGARRRGPPPHDPARRDRRRDRAGRRALERDPPAAREAPRPRRRRPAPARPRRRTARRRGERRVRADGRLRIAGVSDASVDAVWSFDVFVHIAPGDQAGYLGEIARVLRPGGVAAIHHADGRNRGIAPSRAGWRAPMTAALFASLARERGLTVERVVRSWGGTVTRRRRVRRRDHGLAPPRLSAWTFG